VLGRYPRALAIAGAAMALAAPVRADVQRARLGLVSDDPVLARAFGVAMDAWDLDVVVPSVDPPDEEASAAEWARGIAAASRVDIVVWMSTASPAALWWYDARTGQMRSRELGVEPPLDESQAAAVALTLKSELGPGLAAPPKPAALAPLPVPPPANPPPPSDATWQLETGAFARWFGPALVEGRAFVGARAWPRFEGQHWGAGIDVSAGTGLPADDERFRGRWFDATISPTLRFRWMPWRRIVVEPAVGGSVHLTWIAGTLIADGTSRERMFVGGSSDASLGVAFAIGSGVEVAVRASASLWIRYEVFVARSEPLLSLTPVSADAGASLRVRLD
jgi:hypothetical protein